MRSISSFDLLGLRHTVGASPLLMLFGLVACGGTPEFDVPDASPECAPGSVEDGVEPIACPDGEQCLSGRCFAACGGDSDCSTREMCADGVCVGRDGPIPDAGLPDLSVPDMSACMDMCEDGTVCDEGRGECVACLGESECGGLTSICDFAYRTCVPPTTDRCAACNDSLDCTDGSECVEGERERVCLVTCDSTVEPDPCGPSFECADDNFCRPQIGTCTQIRNGIAGVACEMDADCVPIGSSAAAGTCSPELRCRAACAMDVSCPAPGLTCSGGAAPFCDPAPTM